MLEYGDLVGLSPPLQDMNIMYILRYSLQPKQSTEVWKYARKRYLKGLLAAL